MKDLCLGLGYRGFQSGFDARLDRQDRNRQWIGCGKPEEKSSSLPELAFYPDIAVVGFKDALDDGEAEPRAAAFA